jgi:hypothetical protein
LTTPLTANLAAKLALDSALQELNFMRVGNVKAKAEGQGTVELISSCNGRKYILQLEDVLYIPMNRNNLIALGKWDKAGE